MYVIVKLIYMIMYTGRGTEISIDTSLGISGSMVKTLLQDYKGSGHTPFVIS